MKVRTRALMLSLSVLFLVGCKPQSEPLTQSESWSVSGVWVDNEIRESPPKVDQPIFTGDPIVVFIQIADSSAGAKKIEVSLVDRDRNQAVTSKTHYFSKESESMTRVILDDKNAWGAGSYSLKIELDGKMVMLRDLNIVDALKTQ